MAIIGIGSSARRLEDQRLLTGQGRFVDDMVLPQQAYGVVLYSPHAHARIARIDATVAAKSPGVLLVLTGRDAKAEGLGKLKTSMPLDFSTGFRT